MFDREGYSPVFFKEMWQSHRIACITYHKFPKENWAVEEFQETLVTLSCGEVGGASGAIGVRTAVPESQTLDRYGEDDCVPRRDVDDADCARIISERR